MRENSWTENETDKELEPLSSLLTDWSDSEVEEESSYSLGMSGRRRKAAITLTIIWTGTILLHLVSWGIWLILGLTTLMGIHAVRMMLARPAAAPVPRSDEAGVELDPEVAFPSVSLLVAAKNEEAVIGNLVKALCNLDYPSDRYELWVINDNSTDKTPILLDQLTQVYPQLKVIHRSGDATGGKSGALNQALSLTHGEIVAVFDADAHVPPDLLRQVLPLFDPPQMGAVQVRKAIANASTNLWTRGQSAEMALDSFFQQQRIAIGGIGELRGNGQFVRRSALKSCGGWNEETITDDLDLTLRLHLNQWDIGFLAFPAVDEEGVTNALGLWHQRNRWAEGGYQRYLDYWRLIAHNRLGLRKTFDLLMFWITQYILPTAAVPDFVMAIARNRMPILSPVTGLTLTLSLMGMFIGLRRMHPSVESADQKSSKLTSLLVTLLQTLRGTLYMLHWLPVIASTTARMSIRPKRLKWVKTTHQGKNEVWLDMPKHPS
ncbi:MAG: glycosyltransferase family 2 protein [Leptolyngbyaceae bacterium]|nr:glycosyltransferase family 2 protein [Leptolyngbyaceae bacterium]